jgi:YD repeat-containing protein
MVAAEAPAPATQESVPAALAPPDRVSCPATFGLSPWFPFAFRDCPAYAPLLNWGGLCSKPNCMRPCREVQSLVGDPEVSRVLRFEYDHRGRLVRTFHDRPGSRATEPQLSLTWDQQDRPVSESGVGQSRRFEYDDKGRFARSIVSDEHWTAIHYDDAGRVVEEKGKQPDTSDETRYVYDENGRLVESRSVWETHGHITLKDEIDYNRTVYTYDGLGRTRTATYYSVSPVDGDPNAPTSKLEQVTSFVFTYDSAGRVVSTGDESFKYDRLGRLIERRGSKGEIYRYDYECESPKSSPQDSPRD